MKDNDITFKDNVLLLKTLILKDIKSEVRQISDLFSIILFDFISVFIFSGAYNLVSGSRMPLEIFVIEIWIVIFFTLIFVITKIFVKEKESGTLTGILSSPVPINLIIFGKIIYCFILLIILEMFLLLFCFFISVPSGIELTPTVISNLIIFGVLIPTIDLAVCGTITSALAMFVKNKSFIFPILLFPIILPIVNPILIINFRLYEGLALATILNETIFLIAHTILMFSLTVLISDKLFLD